MSAHDSSGVPDYSKGVLVGVSLGLVILAILVVSLRFLVRRRYGQGYAWDDWTILGATALCTASGIVVVLAAELGGMGRHQRLGPNGDLIHYRELTVYEKCRYANEIITTLNLGLVKLSVLLFYRRIFTVKSFKLVSSIWICLVAAWTIAFEITMIAQCVPATEFWDRFEVDYGSSCIQVQPMYEGLAFSDLILDVLVLILPIPFVLMLHMPWNKKIAVLDVLLLGTVVLASGIARAVSFMQVINFTSHNPEVYFKDTLYYTSGPLFWLSGENAIAIMGACLPTLAPLWKQNSSRPPSKANTYLSKLSKSLTSTGPVDDRPERLGSEDGSFHELVVPGAATSVHAENIAPQDLPRVEDGIQIHASFSIRS